MPHCDAPSQPIVGSVAREVAPAHRFVAALFAEHQATVSRYLRRLAPYLDAAIIEDLTADTFERALRAAPRFQDRGHKPLSWLCPIARNLLIDHLRRTSTRMTTSLDALVEFHAEPRCTIRFDEFGERERVAAALQHLTPSQQRVLHDRYWLGLPHGATGNEQAVKSLHKRALASLRPYLEAAS